MYPKLNGFETTPATLYTTAAITPGMAVMLAQNCTAVIPADGTAFCGVCTDIRGNYVTAVLKGFAKVNYSGTAPSVGYNLLSADGKGAVKVDASNGRNILVAEVDTTNKTVSVIL